MILLGCAEQAKSRLLVLLGCALAAQRCGAFAAAPLEVAWSVSAPGASVASPDGRALVIGGGGAYAVVRMSTGVVAWTCSDAFISFDPSGERTLWQTRAGAVVRETVDGVRCGGDGQARHRVCLRMQAPW